MKALFVNFKSITLENPKIKTIKVDFLVFYSDIDGTNDLYELIETITFDDLYSEFPLRIFEIIQKDCQMRGYEITKNDVLLPWSLI